MATISRRRRPMRFKNWRQRFSEEDTKKTHWRAIMVLRMFRRPHKHAIIRRFLGAERWPSGRRHQIANLAYWVTGTEGSNPSLSAKQSVVFTYSLE